MLFCFVFLLGFLGGLLLIIYFYSWSEVLGKSVVFKNMMMWLGFSMFFCSIFSEKGFFLNLMVYFVLEVFDVVFGMGIGILYFFFLVL